MNRFFIHSVRAALLSIAVAPLAWGGAFTAGNLVVYRVGTGTGSLVNTGNAVYLDEYNTSGLLVQSLAMPTTATGQNNALYASGTATSEGMINLSPDGQFLAATGYASTASSSLASTSAATVNRVVGIINASGVVDTSTKLTDFASANNPRSAITSNGTGIWVAGGAGGVRYTTKGSTTSTQLSTTPTNIRGVEIFGGQLYSSDSSGTTVRLGAVGSLLPSTSGQTITNLPGFSTTTGSPYAFFFADLSSTVAGLDTLYVADDAAGLQKWSLSVGNWSLSASGTLGAAADAYRGLTGVVNNGTVSLYAVRKGGSAAAGGGELVSITDSTGYGGDIKGLSPTVLALAGSNQAFRGVAFAPSAVPEPSTFALLAAGAIGLLGYMRRRRTS